MSTSGHAPCLDSWLFDPFCCDCVPTEEDRTPEQEALFQKLRGVAAEVLWRASGRRYGLCSVKVRPCRTKCQETTYQASGVSGPLWTPTLINGKWTNCRGTCNCPCGDCCSAGCYEVTLPGPVHDVTEVVIDGVVLPTDSYRVDDHRKLIRLYGDAPGERACWPACQDMALADGEVGTWSVTYQVGIPLSSGGQYAFSVYLCELWKLCTGQRCRLPLNAEGVFRQGVNIDFSDANIDLLSGMRTGIPEVDTWLAGVNPDRLRQPSQVYSPDFMRPRTQTWPGA